MKKTQFPKPENIDRRWYLIDAQGEVLGRLACSISNLLRGKGKPIFSPHFDLGDFIVVVNAKKIVLTGRKLKQKTHFTHTTRPGSSKFITYEKLMEDRPEEALRLAVKGMLPKNRTRDKILKRLKVYRDDRHPHSAQRLEKLEMKDSKV